MNATVIYNRVPEALWRELEKLIPKHVRSPKGGRPPLDPQRVADGIYFVFRTGCPWKAVPHEIGAGSSLHRYFQEWVAAGVFRKLWQRGLWAYDHAKGIVWQWQSLDAAMNKAPLGGKKTGKNPTDRGKLGVKRSVLSDGRGVVLGVIIDGANRHDVRLALPTLESVPVHRPQPCGRRIQHLCMDKAYDDSKLRRRLRRRHYRPHVKTRGAEISDKRHRHGKARRWVNERTQSWFNRFRRVLIRWEKKADNYLAILHFVSGWIAFRTAGVLG